MAENDNQGSGRYISLGLEIAVGVGVGVAVGWWLDERFGWTPWGLLCGGLLGLAAGMYMLIKDALRMNKP